MGFKAGQESTSEAHKASHKDVHDKSLMYEHLGKVIRRPGNLCHNKSWHSGQGWARRLPGVYIVNIKGYHAGDRR